MSKSKLQSFDMRPFAHLKRIFLEGGLDQDQIVTLDKSQSHYVVRVMRMKMNDELVLFNSENGAWLAHIIDDKKTATQLKLTQQVQKQPKKPKISLLFAPLKTARMDYIVQKAVELGVCQVRPIFTQYTQVKKLNVEKLRANMIEAAEQCETLYVPELQEALPLSSLTENWQLHFPDTHLIFCDEVADSSANMLKLQDLKDQKIAIIIGPEGGFSADERQILLAMERIMAISLGPRILRADTAAVAALSLVQALAGDWY